MKNTILFTLIIFSCGACAQKSNKNTNAETDVASLKLKGKVRSLKKIYLPITPGYQGQPYPAETTLFNEAGYITNVYRDGDTTNYEYATVGQKTIVTVHSRDAYIRKIFRNNVPDSFITYNWAGKVQAMSVYTHDKDGNETGSRIIDSTGKVISATKRWYNNKGEEIKKEIYNAEGKLILYNEFKYKNGQLAELIVFDYNDTKKVLARETYRYNDEGDIIDRRGYTANRQLSSFAPRRYERTFDSKGNWIKQTIYDEILRVSVTTREITYY